MTARTARAAPRPAVAVAPPAGSTRSTTARERRVITRLMRAAERVRRLRFVRPVPVLVQDGAAIIAYAESQIDATELKRARTIYGALGLLPRDISLRDVLLRLLGEQVVGYYDDRNARLIVRDEVMRAFDGSAALTPTALAKARMTLVHELVHALQDQHLGLAKRLHLERDTDSANAFKALYEGDAMLAMSAFASRGEPETSPPPLQASSLAGSELARAPAIVREPLLFAYFDGLSFVTHLFERGGWERIDRSYGRPPASTEQVLHPQSTPGAQRVAIPHLPDAEHAFGPEHDLLYEDTLGELELSVYFGLGSNHAESRRAATGWDGDRLYLYASENSEAIAVWLTTWDSAPDALEALGAAERVRLAEAGRVRSSVARAGRNLLIVRNASSEQEAQLHARFAHWTRH